MTGNGLKDGSSEKNIEVEHLGGIPRNETLPELEFQQRPSIRAYLLLVRSLVDHLERLLDLEETLRDLESMDETFHSTPNTPEHVCLEHVIEHWDVEEDEEFYFEHPVKRCSICDSVLTEDCFEYILPEPEEALHKEECQ